MSFVEIRRAYRRDLDQICSDLKLTQEEINTMQRWYFSSTDIWAGFYQDRVACIYGVVSASMFSDTAYLWLTTNDLVKEHPFLFVRHSQMIVQKLLEGHQSITGHVSAKSPNSIRWLEWLGVKLHRAEIVNNMIPFELKRSA